MLKLNIKPIAKIVEWLVFLVLIFFVFVILSPVLPIKYLPRTFIVVSGSMEPTIKTGSIAFTMPVDTKTIVKGDVIAFTSPSDPKDTILHRVNSISSVTPLQFKTKGDNNNAVDAWDIMDVDVKGVYFGAIPYLGNAAAFIKKPLGFGLIIILPALLFVIFQIINIKKAITQEIDRKVAQALDSKKKSEQTKKIKPPKISTESLTLSIVLFITLFSLSTLQAIKASFIDTVTVSGISLSVKDFVPPSIPANLHWTNPDVHCGGYTNSYTITADWDDSTTPSGSSKTIAYYEYQSYNPPGGWIWPTDLNNPTIVYSSQISGPFSVGEGVYGFRVRAVDSLGYNSDWSSVDFAGSCQITYHLPIPPAPSLVLPANNSSRNTSGLIMDWTDVAGDYHNPLYYIYQSARNPGFSPIAYTSGHLTNSQIPAPGTPDGDYWWHVKTCDALDNCSDWSAAWKVTVDSAAPTTPGPIGWTVENSPVGSDYVTGTDFDRFTTCNGAVNYSPMSNIWKPSTDATLIIYEREVYTPIDNRIYFNNSLTNNYENGGGAIDGTTYWVRIRAKDAAGNYSAWTSKCSVKYDATPPTSVITTPTNPGLGHTTSVDTSIVNWDGVIGGTSSDSLSGINHVELSINRFGTDQYWDDSTSTWVSGTELTTRVTAIGTTTWIYTLLDHPTGVTYVITSHAVDNAGNIENSYILIIENKAPPTQPAATLTLSEDKKTVSFKVENISGYQTLDYALQYSAYGIEKGIVGSGVDITGQTEYEKTNLDLATCSNEDCTYDQDVKDFQLTIILKDKDGKETTVESKL